MYRVRGHPLLEWRDGARLPDPNLNPNPNPDLSPDPNPNPNPNPDLSPDPNPNSCPNPDMNPNPNPDPDPNPNQARGAPARCVCLRHWAALGCSSSELVGWQRFQDVGLRRLATCGAAPA